MYFVYLIQSLTDPEQIYTGYTEDLKKRLSEHNAGITFHTSKYIPWKLVTNVAFSNKSKAIEFEKFLKSGSGRVFAKLI